MNDPHTPELPLDDFPFDGLELTKLVAEKMNYAHKEQLIQSLDALQEAFILLRQMGVIK